MLNLSLLLQQAGVLNLYGAPSTLRPHKNYPRPTLLVLVHNGFLGGCLTSQHFCGLWPSHDPLGKASRPMSWETLSYSQPAVHAATYTLPANLSVCLQKEERGVGINSWEKWKSNALWPSGESATFSSSSSPSIWGFSLFFLHPRYCSTYCVELCFAHSEKFVLNWN